MGKLILITGGAGFVGSHLADELLAAGHRVRALDSLSAQVHGAGAGRPVYLDHEVELIVGDVRDGVAVRHALQGVDQVVHLAAAVGVGQSMYELEHYTSTNGVGTAVLLEALVERPVERLVVASSMSLYGEGLYKDPRGLIREGRERTLEQIKARRWEVTDADGQELVPVATPETKGASTPSVYALTKHDQERMCLMVGRAYRIPTVALRLFNIYGTRQALSNPYTGVLAIFAARLLNGRPPMVNEDGQQRRDFVSVRDVARAFSLALCVPHAEGHAFNIGSGGSWTVKDIGVRLAQVLGRPDLAPQISGRYRVGDIRHCFADIQLARRVLGFEPQVKLEEGLVELAQWLSRQAAKDRAAEASAELADRGLAL